MKTLLVVTALLMGLLYKGAWGIKCYVNDGDLSDSILKGSPTLKEEDGFKTCSKTTTDMGKLSVTVHAGEMTEAPSGCMDMDKDGATAEICFCNTDLCNNAPPTAAAHVAVLICAMPVLLKLII